MFYIKHCQIANRFCVYLRQSVVWLAAKHLRPPMPLLDTGSGSLNEKVMIAKNDNCWSKVKLKFLIFKSSDRIVLEEDSLIKMWTYIYKEI